MFKIDLNKLASKIDIGLLLAEVTGEIDYHKVKVDEKNNKIDIYYTAIEPVKKITFNLKAGE